jgi:hypothetical protein
MPKIGETSEAKIISTGYVPPPNYRPAVQVSLGCHVEGVAQPHVDPGDPLTVEAGVWKRACCEPPTPNPELIAELREFTRDFVRRTFQKLPYDSDTSVLAWLAKTNYPESRKKELLQLYMESDGILRRKDKVVKSFVKAETYPDFKHARMINSRSDVFKCHVGPIFRLIEEVVFKHEAFIKKVPVAERPQYIVDLLKSLGAEYNSADFTAYESHFTKLIMENVEFQLYDYMTEDLPEHEEFMKLMHEVLAGDNVCQHKFFDLFIEAKRMSGEMNTSLGNGFTNLILILFLYHKKGQENVKCVVEGDDSLVASIGEAPTASDFASVGFTIKLETHREIEDASFCGLIFDSEDLINITDPFDVLSSFGWASKFYVKCKRSRLLDLLRCKALSYLHQYPGCPVVQSLALYALRCTRGRDVNHFIKNNRGINNWERDQLLELVEKNKIKKLPTRPVPINTRLLMDRKFGLDVESQLVIEKYLDSLDTLQVLSGPLLELDFGVYHRYFSQYSRAVVHGENDVDFPNEPWVKMSRFVPEFVPCNDRAKHTTSPGGA